MVKTRADTRENTRENTTENTMENSRENTRPNTRPTSRANTSVKTRAFSWANTRMNTRAFSWAKTSVKTKANTKVKTGVQASGTAGVKTKLRARVKAHVTGWEDRKDKATDEGPSHHELPSKRPCYVVRPAPAPVPKVVFLTDGSTHRLDREAWMQVFARLPRSELAACLTVCKTWHRWVLDASLWRDIDLRDKCLKQSHLIGIVRRQPKRLVLAGTNISRAQLEWLAPRLPHLKTLVLSRCSWAAVSALCSSSCPLLYKIDLSWVSGLNTACLRDLIAPPVDHRPGVDDSVSRFHRCTHMSLSGSEITNQALQYISVWLPKLQALDISYCTGVTYKGLEFLCHCANLEELSLDACHDVKSLEPIAKFTAIRKVYLGSRAELNKEFVESYAGKFAMEGETVLVRKIEETEENE